MSRDIWEGDPNQPMSRNAWLYVYDNPVTLTDPSGHDPWWCEGRPDEEVCIALWILDNGGDLTSTILESIYWHFPSEALGILQREFNIKLPSGYQYRLALHSSGAIAKDHQYGVNFWFFSINWGVYANPSLIEISTLACTFRAPRVDSHIIDNSVYITDLAFSDWEFDPDDVAATMVHEAVHAWQEDVAAMNVTLLGNLNIASLDWHSEHEKGMERQASQYVIMEHQRGRLEMSSGRRNYERIYELGHLGGSDYPFNLPAGVP